MTHFYLKTISKCSRCFKKNGRSKCFAQLSSRPDGYNNIEPQFVLKNKRVK